METDQLSKRSLVIDEKSQYQLYKKQAFRHFINYLILGIKYILTYRKEKFTKRLLTYGSIFFAIAYPFYYYIVNPNVVEKWKIMPEKVVYVSDETKTMDKFLEVLGDAESGGDYKVVNPAGYLGKYQMSQTTLKGIGLDVDKDLFLSTPKLQEVAMQLLMKYNKNILGAYIGKYSGKTINGIIITESGILAGAHLGGAGSVINFLKTNGTDDFKDGNGVATSSYMKKFGGYKLIYD